MSKFKFYREDDDYHATISTTHPEEDADAEIAILEIHESIKVSSMEAMADTLNVLAETRQTPRQLAEQVKVLREALENIADTDPDDGVSWFHNVANAALAETDWSKT